MKYHQLTSLLCVSVFLCACASGQQRNTTTQNNAAIVSEEVSKGINKVRASADYVLQPGDLVDIQVFMEEGMTRVLRISTNGTVTFPLIGNIKIAGYSVSNAEDYLANTLKRYIKSPQVSMLIKEYGNKTVYVLGQVAKPAAIQIPPEKPLTVLEAITSVGGFTDIAATSKVRVLRIENGQENTIDVDVTQITKQGNKALDISLKPGDVVFVPQSMF